MKTNQWDKDIEKGLERIKDVEKGLERIRHRTVAELLEEHRKKKGD